MLEEGNRSMVDDEEWDWIEDHATGRLRPPAARHLAAVAARAAACTTLEAWSEAVCGGAWGGAAAQLASELRQARGPRALGGVQRVLRRAGRAPARGGARASAARAPASIVTLSGDVHHAYLFEVAFPRGAGVQSAVCQAVCSPYRNPLDGASGA